MDVSKNNYEIFCDFKRALKNMVFYEISFFNNITKANIGSNKDIAVKRDIKKLERMKRYIENV